MKHKPYGRNQLLRDNIEMNKQLNQCIARNVELECIYEDTMKEVDKANKHIENVATFINEYYPDFWDEYTEWDKANGTKGKT